MSARKKWLTASLLILPVVASIALWMTDTVTAIDFDYSVPQITQVSWFETHYLYLYVHVFTFVPVFFLSFDRRVHFYTRWKHLLPAIIIIALLFILWDIVFTEMRVWGFNHNYHLIYSFWGLPIEEWLFFFSVPFACLFIYACLNHYVKKDILAPFDQIISVGGGLALIVLGLWQMDKLYTVTTCLLTGSVLLCHYWTIDNTYRSRFYLAYLISWIPFLLVDGVLTGGFTQAPVVLYHPEEFMNIRIGAVPLEDSIYSLLMLLGVTTLMEYFQKRSMASVEKRTMGSAKNTSPISSQKAQSNAL